MELSVVVPTLNAREPLEQCLDALAADTPSTTEVVVVNGPSSDGTTGSVRERDDVDVLVEIAERNRNVARNAGLEATSGGVVAFLDDHVAVTEGWHDALAAGVAAGTDVVTGPIGGETSTASLPVRGPRVTAGNVALVRPVLEALDGFDEYLPTEGVGEFAHRLRGRDLEVTWSASMRAKLTTPRAGPAVSWGERYRSLAYCLGKNDGPRPRVPVHLLRRMGVDGVSSARAVLRGEGTTTNWFGNGRAVTVNAAGGLLDGLRARYADRSPRRNPNGLSARRDRVVQRYEVA